MIYDKCDQKVALSELRVTSEWQYGLCCIGSDERANKSRLEARFYRVAIKKFVDIKAKSGESDAEMLGNKKKFLVWCLDEGKSNIIWMPSVGIVYELPDMLEPTVWPWQVKHIW